MSADTVLIDRSYKKLREQAGGAKWLREYLGLDSWDIIQENDDFHGALNTTRWANLFKSGNGAADLVAVADSSTASLVSGTDDNGYAAATQGHLFWKGDNHAICTARLHIGAAITNAKMEFGFSDDVTGDVGIINDAQVTTPTWVAADGAGWVYDTDATDATTVWQHHGVAAGTGIKTVTTLAPVASTYQRVLVALRGSSARYMLFDANDEAQYDSGWKADAITSTVGLTPFIIVQSRATTTKTLTVDQVTVMQKRTTA